MSPTGACFHHLLPQHHVVSREEEQSHLGTWQSDLSCLACSCRVAGSWFYPRCLLTPCTHSSLKDPVVVQVAAKHGTIFISAIPGTCESETIRPGTPHLQELPSASHTQFKLPCLPCKAQHHLVQATLYLTPGLKDASFPLRTAVLSSRLVGDIPNPLPSGPHLSHGYTVANHPLSHQKNHS